MDDIVKQALAKWPNVPACAGWLALDARGQWWMRDEAAQAKGVFPAGRGSLLQHAQLIAFIGRNYAADDAGQWYFQNGPQRVYVELEATPWIWRVDEAGSVTAHTGQPAGAVQEALLDEDGRLYLRTDLGFGLVHSLDMLHAAAQVEACRWRPDDAVAAALPARFGYVPHPSLSHPNLPPQPGHGGTGQRAG